jgi:hypothetical protein
MRAIHFGTRYASAIKTALLMLALSGAPLVQAETAAQPVLNAGDTWTYVVTVESGANGWRQTREQIDVVRTTSDRIYAEFKPAGSQQMPKEIVSGIDWSRSRNVNGTETIVNQPLSFPLSTGKAWETQYQETNPNPQHASESWDRHYKVTGMESVTVPAGTFNAIKIESEGQWTARLAPGVSAATHTVANANGATILMQTQRTTPSNATGRLYSAVWYVPEIGRWVKSVEEYYDANEVRTQRLTNELESYKRVQQ